MQTKGQLMKNLNTAFSFAPPSILSLTIYGGIAVPKYYEFKVCGYYLYYTASCVIEAMHVHASDRKLTEADSAKFFVKSNGDTTVEKQGTLTEREVRKIRAFIKEHYKEMYLKWMELSDTGFYGEK